MTALRRLASLLSLAALATFAAPNARASESYPRAVQSATGSPCQPACTLCHTRPSGGLLTANTPVGISMRRAGLKSGNTGLVLDAIATLEMEGTDSDADGTTDVDELRAGTDPNALEGELECLPPEDEGCAISGCAVKQGRSYWAFVVGLALVALARRRRAARARLSR